MEAQTCARPTPAACGTRASPPPPPRPLVPHAPPARPRPLTFHAPAPPQVATGQVEMSIRGVKSTKAGFFSGKKRFVQVCVQVRGGTGDAIGRRRR